MKRFFITGTDTNCGKTYVTCQLMNYFKSTHKNVHAIKPVVSGSITEAGEEIYEDIRALQHHNGNSSTIAQWCFQAPISPHIAAYREGVSISADKIFDFCNTAAHPECDYLFIEGAGGLMAPLNEDQTWINFLVYSQIPVILVVGMRLGCLNHALLTSEVLKSHGIACAGWVANCLDPAMLELSANIATLKERLKYPLLATLAYNDSLTSEVFI